jgi:hypothetical protein
MCLERTAEIHPFVFEFDDRDDLGEPLEALDERIFDDFAKTPCEGEKPIRS